MRRGGDGARTALSVVILSGNRADLLARCLDSLHHARRPPGFEVVVAIVGRQPAVEPLLSAVSATRPYVRVVRVPREHPGGARNRALQFARGDIVHFLDDDVTVEPRIFERLLDAFAARDDVVAIGGPNLTPPSSSLFQWTAGAVLGSVACSLPVRRRYSVQHERDVDERSLILCNLAVRREVLDRVSFDASLVCAEENDFLRKAVHHGGRFRYRPDVVVFHERRATMRGHVQQMAKYGHGRAQLLRRSFSPRMVVFLLPIAVLGAVPALAALPFLTAFSTLWWLLAAPIAVYLAAVAATALLIGVHLRKPRAVPLALVLLPATHGAYAVGLLRGLRGRRYGLLNSAYWDTVAELDDNLPAGWRRHARRAHVALVRRCAGEPAGVWLKTDLYEELSPERAVLPALGAATWVATDVSSEVVRRARGREPLLGVVADVRHLPFREGAFDGVLSTSTLDHFEHAVHIEQSLHELHGALRAGGDLVLTLDNADHPLVRLRNALPRPVAKVTGLVPFEVGSTLGASSGRAMLRRARFDVEATEWVLHAPFVVGTRPARFGWYERRVLPLFDRLARTPLARFTGHFVAFHATKPVAVDASDDTWHRALSVPRSG